jgi:hypothetical protein
MGNPSIKDRPELRSAPANSIDVRIPGAVTRQAAIRLTKRFD